MKSLEGRVIELERDVETLRTFLSLLVQIIGSAGKSVDTFQMNDPQATVN